MQASSRLGILHHRAATRGVDGYDGWFKRVNRLHLNRGDYKLRRGSFQFRQFDFLFGKNRRGLQFEFDEGEGFSSSELCDSGRKHRDKE
jgi:hypothetical protein